MIKKSLLMLLLLSYSCLGFGQNSNYKKFRSLFESKNKDTTAIVKLLHDWRISIANDPEYYTSAFNYYYFKAKEEIISLQTERPNGENFALLDKSGKVAGYLGSSTAYNDVYVIKAMNVIDTAIEKFPKRLDIRFGKCYLLGQLRDYENFTNEIIQTIEYSGTINHEWLWTENKPETKDMLIGTVHAYMKQLYNTEEDSLLSNIIRLGEATLRYHPKETEILSLTAISLLLTNNFDKAIEYLKIAEKENPKDIIVLNNLAQGFKMKGDKENAIKYYELIIRHGDQEAQARAKKAIEDLKQE